MTAELNNYFREIANKIFENIQNDWQVKESQSISTPVEIRSLENHYKRLTIRYIIFGLGWVGSLHWKGTSPTKNTTKGMDTDEESTRKKDVFDKLLDKSKLIRRTPTMHNKERKDDREKRLVLLRGLITKSMRCWKKLS